MIPIKKGPDIDAMRKSGKAVARVLSALEDFIKPGMTTAEVDSFAASKIDASGGKSAFLGYRGFPGTICISVNEEVVHGIGGPRVLQEGDIVKVDVGIIINGWVGDSATTIAVGSVTPEVQSLMDATRESLYEGISQARQGRRLGDICSAIEQHVVTRGYSIVKEFVGHGVGRDLHEEPQIPNFGQPGTGPKLKAGMVLAIEPMVNMGTAGVRMLADRWTVVTADKQPSSHYEHSVLVTKGEPEILTARPGAGLPLPQETAAS